MRGTKQDVDLQAIDELLRTRGPHAVVVEVPDTREVLALNTPDQFALVERFLGGGDYVSV